MKQRVYGYCRVSTPKQSIERQIRNIRAEYPEAVIVTEEYTGTKLDRPAWSKLYKAAQEGDTIIITELSRLGRSLMMILDVLQSLLEKGVKVIAIKEGFEING